MTKEEITAEIRRVLDGKATVENFSTLIDRIINPPWIKISEGCQMPNDLQNVRLAYENENWPGEYYTCDAIYYAAGGWYDELGREWLSDNECYTPIAWTPVPETRFYKPDMIL